MPMFFPPFGPFSNFGMMPFHEPTTEGAARGEQGAGEGFAACGGPQQSSDNSAKGSKDSKGQESKGQGSFSGFADG